MNRVYRHRPRLHDEYLGRVTPDGKVYESRLGPDRYIGRVDLNTGQIYEARVGPDKKIGRVELDSGKVYLSRLGPDEYLGEVRSNGKIYHHKWLAPDEYLGRVEDMTSLTHGGAAFLLLVQPAYDEAEAASRESIDPDDAEAGQATAPAD